MTSWLRELQEILSRESETELAYIYGQQLQHFPHLLAVKPKLPYMLWPLGFLRFLSYQLGKGERRRSERHCDFLAFAGTSNQMDALEPTLQALKAQHGSLLAVGERKFFSTKTRKQLYVPLTLTWTDALKSLALFKSRYQSLRAALNEFPPPSRKIFINTFCRAYVYLPYFLRLLTECRPQFVIVANDHNVANRSLISCAHYLGIKTVYMQHASVSRFFPALRFDYAFLDGQASLEAYRACEENHPGQKKDLPRPRVFLTGQKKQFSRSVVRSPRPYVGVALNLLDTMDKVIEAVLAVCGRGGPLKVRWHPSMSVEAIQTLKRRLCHIEGLKLSDPGIEYVGDFLASCHTIVAGNSSIHLEAAILGVRPIYHELCPATAPDYYGYVAAGLATEAKSLDDLALLLEVQPCNRLGPDIDAVRFYSSTFATEWDGREGELVADILLRLANHSYVDECHRL